MPSKNVMYRNAGNAGREWSQIKFERYLANEISISFDASGEKNIVLNQEQMTDLRNRLDSWLGKPAIDPGPPLIEEY